MRSPALPVQLRRGLRAWVRLLLGSMGTWHVVDTELPCSKHWRSYGTGHDSYRLADIFQPIWYGAKDVEAPACFNSPNALTGLEFHYPVDN